jgi:hypothetical protein
MLEELLAKDAIREVLFRYCRALDRMDRAEAYAVWHEDGTAHYIDLFEGTGHGFVDWVWEAHAAMQCHSHQITNTLIVVDEDTARSESYVSLALWTLPDAEGEQTEIAVRGRYLDRWSRREDRWAIDHRVHIVDMQTLNPLTPGAISGASSRDPSDPSFALFGN